MSNKDKSIQELTQDEVVDASGGWALTVGDILRGMPSPGMPGPGGPGGHGPTPSPFNDYL